MQKFKCHCLPDNHGEHVPIEVYEQHLRETILTPLQALKVGCVVVVLSGKDIWHEARTFHPDKGHHEALEVPSAGDVALQLKVSSSQQLDHEDIEDLAYCCNGLLLHTRVPSLCAAVC